jgi:hypothetical protein
MIRELALFAGYAFLFFVILNSVLLLWKYRDIPAKIRSVVYFVGLCLATDLSSRYLFDQASNNLFLLHIYTLLEFLAWSYFFYQLFRNQDWVRTKLPWLVGIGVILIVANTVFLEPVTGFNSNAKTFVQAILIFYAVYYLFTSFGQTDLRQPLPLATTLINFAILLYYSGSLFIFMFSKLLGEQGTADDLQYGFWAVNAVLSLLLQVFIFISLWKVAFRKTNSS